MLTYLGEHLMPGIMGNFFVVLAFIACLISCSSYFFASKNPQDPYWYKMARISYGVHGVAVLGIIGSLFFIIYNHYFEYHYAWAHSSISLPTHFMISCFWEGQEGSFLLWAFWQLVLGSILMFTAKDFEKPVMTIITLSQVFILSMLLGVVVFGQHIGSSPFILLRNALDAPIFDRPDYLNFIKDGNGLNPLLQNYWMVIHPPTLFFGFASMVVPFAFAIAGLWQKKYKEWISVSLPWALLAVMVLGTGIIMGSFWAYEALNFGGFWAWDPVENASVIPWLTLIAGVHVMIAYKNSGHSYFTATFLVIISFILVLYASFLTRSGILGETSVHAFTDLGMSGQLLVFLLFFLGLSTYLIIKNWKKLPITKKDEATYSREFWLFIGAMVLIISCFQIILTTSIPVVNALFGTKFAPPLDVVNHYNQWQAPMAILVTFIAAFAQFLKYKESDSKKFWINASVIAVAAMLIASPIIYLGDFYQNPVFILLIFSCVFTILSNGKIFLEIFKGKIKLAGSSIAHIGFGLMLMGALIAASKNNVLSINTSGYNYGKDFNEKNTRENVLLFINEPLQMGKYSVSYIGDSSSGVDIFYKVNYQVKNKEGKIIENFTLKPKAQINPKMGLVASPDTKHYLDHDIYTHVSSVPKKEEHSQEDGHGHEAGEVENDFLEAKTIHLKIKDSVKIENTNFYFENLENKTDLKNIKLEKGDIAVGAKLKIKYKGIEESLSPIYLIKGNTQFSLPLLNQSENFKLIFSKLDPKKGEIEIQFIEKKPKEKDFIIMKAVKFPYINLLWSGTIIMVIGFVFSILRRKKEL